MKPDKEQEQLEEETDSKNSNNIKRPEPKKRLNSKFDGTGAKDQWSKELKERCFKE